MIGVIRLAGQLAICSLIRAMGGERSPQIHELGPSNMASMWRLQRSRGGGGVDCRFVVSGTRDTTALAIPGQSVLRVLGMARWAFDRLRNKEGEGRADLRK